MAKPPYEVRMRRSLINASVRTENPWVGEVGVQVLIVRTKQTGTRYPREPYDMVIV